jgi:DNA-directed RNA polymerase specialized sigma24 family protein
MALPLTIPAAIPILAALLCLLIVSLILWRRHTEHLLLKRRMAQLREKIETALNDEEFEIERASFGKALQAAGLTTQLQRPRLENLAKIDKQPPDKYRILSTLAAQGCNVEEIATILGVSRVEADQLISLSNVARCGR